MDDRILAIFKKYPNVFRDALLEEQTNLQPIRGFYNVKSGDVTFSEDECERPIAQKIGNPQIAVFGSFSTAMTMEPNTSVITNISTCVED